MTNPASRPKRRPVSPIGIAPLVAALVFGACQREPSEQEVLGVMGWLTCDECTDGERSLVTDTLGGAALPLLTEVLLDFPDHYTASIAREIGADWALLSSPTLDSLAYVEYYGQNTRATAQRRAALALGDLGAADVLREALDRAALIGFRADVTQTIESVLAGMVVTPRPAGQPASVEIQPRSMQLGVGSGDLLGAVVKDASGSRLLADSVIWSSMNSSVASVNSEGMQRARLTAISPGSADLVADVAGGVTDRITVIVTPASADTLRKTAGEPQTMRVGQVTGDSLEVEVANSSGVVVRTPVIWRIVLGDASFVPSGLREQVGLTGVSGRAWVHVRAGATTRPVQIRASIANDAESFRINVVN